MSQLTLPKRPKKDRSSHGRLLDYLLGKTPAINSNSHLQFCSTRITYCSVPIAIRITHKGAPLWLLNGDAITVNNARGWGRSSSSSLNYTSYMRSCFKPDRHPNKYHRRDTPDFADLFPTDTPYTTLSFSCLLNAISNTRRQRIPNWEYADLMSTLLPHLTGDNPALSLLDFNDEREITGIIGRDELPSPTSGYTISRHTLKTDDRYTSEELGAAIPPRWSPYHYNLPEPTDDLPLGTEMFIAHRPPTILFTADRPCWPTDGAPSFLHFTPTFYLFGMDERSYFCCQLPHPCYSITSAFESLMPEEVRQFIKSGDTFTRQGEWFFIPAPHQDELPSPTKAHRIRRSALPKDNPYSNSHLCRNILSESGIPLVIGDVKHTLPTSTRATREHLTITLDGWHYAFCNTAVRSWSAGVKFVD